MKYKCFILLLMILVGSLSLVNAQNDGKMVLKGTIVDAKTNEPVPFANLGLLGTVAGVASDMDGRFELAIPDKYALYKVRISAVGFASAEYKAYELKDKPDLKIRLRSVTYGIGEVDVYGQLLIYKKMLQNVVSSISKNYLTDPYNYEGYFKHVVNVDGMEKSKEATVTIYDAAGYNRTDVSDVFRNINYRYNQVRRSEPAVSIYDGLTCMDDILTADVVRNTRNVLDIFNSRDYKLKSKGKIIYEGDSVQIISYSVKNPTISTSGHASVTTYSGEIYVNLKDMAVLKNITNITSSGHTSLGRNIVAVGQKVDGPVVTQIVTTYKKLRSFYFLSGVNVVYTYNNDGKEVQENMEYVTTRVRPADPEVIKGRTYYEDIEADEEFWNRYSNYFEE